MATSTNAGTPPLPPLLDVQPHIWKRNYRNLGLASWDSHNTYIFNLDGGQRPFKQPDSKSFYGLLLSCRAIYREAAALLYAANHFVISNCAGPGGPPKSLAPLRSLTASSLQCLSNLSIVLHQVDCRLEGVQPFWHTECC